MAINAPSDAISALQFAIFPPTKMISDEWEIISGRDESITDGTFTILPTQEIISNRQEIISVGRETIFAQSEMEKPPAEMANL